MEGKPEYRVLLVMDVGQDEDEPDHDAEEVVELLPELEVHSDSLQAMVAELEVDG